MRLIQSMNNTPEINRTCNECQTGQMHRKQVTFLTWLGNELITVPDFPAQVCDVCGRREYDMDALNRLSLLLSPNAGKPSRKKRPAVRTRTANKTSPPDQDIA